MKPRIRRSPFNHVKDIYGENLEKYSYNKIERDPAASKKAFKQNIPGKFRYESVRGKILEILFLFVIFFSLGIGVYFLLTSIAKA